MWAVSSQPGAHVCPLRPCEGCPRHPSIILVYPRPAAASASLGPPCWSLVLALFPFPGLSQFVQLSLHGTHAETKTTLCPTGCLGPVLGPPVRCVLTVLCGPGVPHTARPFPVLPHGHPARHSSLTSKVHRCVDSPSQLKWLPRALPTGLVPKFWICPRAPPRHCLSCPAGLLSAQGVVGTE